MVVMNGKHKLIGFVNLGEAHDYMERLAGMMIYHCWNICLFQCSHL